MQCGAVPLNILTLFCAGSFFEETETLFLSDGAEESSPNNDRTIPLLNNFLTFFDRNFLNVYISSSYDKQHDIMRNVC